MKLIRPWNNRKFLFSVSCLYCLLGCGANVPVPVNGYNLDRPEYNKINPGAPKVSIGSVTLGENGDTGTNMGPCGKLSSGKPAVFHGTIVHPDKRYVASAVLVTVFKTKEGKTREVVNEAGAMAKGEGGRLAFELEMVIPKGFLGECDFEVKVLTVKPGRVLNSEIDEWHPIACTGQVNIEL